MMTDIGLTPPATRRFPAARTGAVIAGLAAFVALAAWRFVGAAGEDGRIDAPAVVPVAEAAAAAPIDADGDGWAGFAVVPERPAPVFELTDHTGAPWSLSSARGRVAALFFGYTRCPDVCPQTMQRVQQAVATLGPAGDDVAVVLVTTDPDHDTSELLARYVGGFDPRFVGLTGTPDAIRAVAGLYNALPAPEPAADGAAEAATGHGVPIDPTLHSSRLWLVDASGQLRVSFTGPYTPADVAHDLSLLLAERR